MATLLTSLYQVDCTISSFEEISIIN